MKCKLCKNEGKNLLLKKKIIEHERLFQFQSLISNIAYVFFREIIRINFMTIGVKLNSLYIFSNFRQEFYFQNKIKYNY